MKNELADYEYYIALCIAHAVQPLPLDEWRTLITGLKTAHMLDPHLPEWEIKRYRQIQKAVLP